MPPEEIVADNTGSSSFTPEPAAPTAPALTNPTAIVEGARDVSDEDLLSALSTSRAERPAEEASEESTPDEAPKAAPAPAKPPPTPPVDPKIAAQVEAAVKARAEQAEARERELKQYRDQGTRIVSEAEAYAAQRKQQADAEYAQLLAELRKDPLAAAKKAGWDPVELVANIAEYDTPAARAQREALATKAETKSEVQALREEIAQRDRASAEAAARAQRERAHKDFEAVATTRYPGFTEHLARPGMREFFIEQGNRRADELAAKGEPITYEGIADYLATTYGFGQAPTPPKGAPAQTPAGKAARGLSQSEQSERSGGDSRKFHELSEAEQDAVLLAEQKERSRRRNAQA